MIRLALANLLAPAILAQAGPIFPTTYYRTFSHAHPVLLKIKPGEVVVTRTLDSGGQDEKGVKRIEPFNPLNGPFFVEGAEPGDALAVKIHKLTLNRNWGWSAFRLGLFAITPEHVEHVYPADYKANLIREGRSNLVPWDIDLEKKTVRLREPVSKVASLEFPARPMLGCIGVAPAGDFAPTSGPSGSYGGNLDYNRIGEGATVYLPVYHAGGLLFLGDGHALQADGEPTGTGIETTLEVEFSVALKKAAKLTGPRVETAEEIISLGSQPEFASALDNGLKMATTDMVAWLTDEYGLEPWAAHLLIGYQGQYDVVTVAGSMALRVHKSRLPAAKVAEKAAPPAPPSTASAIVRSEFLPGREDAPECHASTLAETPQGLVAAWFGGTSEGAPDVGIYTSRQVDGEWSEPTRVADGVQHAAKRYPAWNPVLYQPEAGPLLLFYKVGPNPRRWWGMKAASDDSGRSWSQPCRLPEDILGPIKNKPIRLPGGDLICPSSTEQDGWRIQFDRSPDLGRTWDQSAPVADPEVFGAIQPSLLVHPDGRLQALCRSRKGRVVETWSGDGGKTWTPLAATALPNPNSGIDAVTLKDGRHLLVYNHTTRDSPPGNRAMLNVALSRDGKAWEAALTLENQPGEYSYPAAIQSADGLVHITYTWRRQKVRHLAIDPARLSPIPMKDGQWPEATRAPAGDPH